MATIAVEAARGPVLITFGIAVIYAARAFAASVRATPAGAVPQIPTVCAWVLGVGVALLVFDVLFTRHVRRALASRSVPGAR